MNDRETRRRIRKQVAALALAISVALGSRVPAAEQTATGPEKKATVAGEDGLRTLRRLPANLGRGILGVFHRDTLMPLVVGGVATGGAWVLDEDMRGWINPEPGDGWGQALETGGGPVWSSVFVASLFTAGRISKNTRFRAATYDALDAAVMNVVYFQSIKLVAQRTRPNGSNDQSFPSGHTSNAFALATVAERHYGWKMGVPAYLLAGVMGASRMKQDMHYFSDVMAGATLGYIVGRTVVRVNSRPLAGGSGQGASLHVAPIVARRARGVQLSLSF
ncbi:MAG TPA: phosphatase PAP2 family protein [Vicinamibacteria bacterium]|nr:phosphatase PAP2 family protein [Vicinamibacteria bacterium]